MKDAGNVIAYYDGLCPLCVREMRVYETRGRGRVILQDVNGDIPEDVDREAALRALWLRLPDGRLVTGWDAFLAIWERTSGMSWAAALTRPWPIRKTADAIYRFLAPFRPRRRCDGEQCEIDAP